MGRLFSLTYATASVLLAVRSGQRYGFEIMDATGLPDGTVYPILRRLERRHRPSRAPRCLPVRAPVTRAPAKTVHGRGREIHALDLVRNSRLRSSHRLRKRREPATGQSRGPAVRPTGLSPAALR